MALEVTNLKKIYGDKTVVNDLSFEMKDGGVFALLGTNGAGKTTSIRMILGMLAKNGGKVLWDGKEFNAREVNVGYLAEERGLYPKYTIMDQLMYFANLRNVSKDVAKKRIKEWSEKLELDEYIYPTGKKKTSKNAEQLSKGNQQKVQLMAALLSDPKLIVLDEPLSGLDPVNTDIFKEIIRDEIQKGKYIIMSSHQMATIEEFCSDIVILSKGNTVLSGDLNEIKKGYGRNNLLVKTEKDILPYIKSNNIEIKNQTPNEIQLHIDDEKQADNLLKDIISNELGIIKFELREPSLHEIFVEKVGEEQGEEE